MNRTIKSSLAASAILALLSGCATGEEDPYLFREGWRKAEVVRISPGAAIDNPPFLALSA